MNASFAEILELLLDGIHPTTGEIFPVDHVCNDPQVVRALHHAIQALRQQSSDAPTPNRSGRLNAGRAWTREDDQQLRALFMQDASMDEMCSNLQRRKRGILNRLAYLKLISNDNPNAKPGLEKVGTRWLPEDDEILRSMFQQKRPLEEMATHLRRTQIAVEYRMVTLKLIDHRGQYVDGERPWRQKDTEDLRTLFANGASVPELAKHFDRTEAAIHARLFYMGLIKTAPEIFPHRK